MYIYIYVYVYTYDLKNIGSRVPSLTKHRPILHNVLYARAAAQHGGALVLEILPQSLELL